MAIPIIGELLNTIIGKGADLISEFIPDKDKAAEFKHKFSIAVLEDKDLERQAEVAMFEAEQVTHQVALNQSDLYTKRTRPKIARQSWYITAAYALSGMIIPAFPTAWGWNAPAIEWQIFLVLASPGLTYMGVRGFEKWKMGGSK